MRRLECLDGLRGVLAVYVMIGHMAPFAALPAWLQAAVSHGGAAVDVFFMLSGLVIMRSLEACRFAAWPFLIARVARIYPVYLTMFAMAVAMQAVPVDLAAAPWIAGGGPAGHILSQAWPSAWVADIAAHVTMVHGLCPNSVAPNLWVSFLGAAWSLSTEWQFYVIALLLARTRMGVGWMAAGFLLMGVMGLTWDLTAPYGWHFSRAFLPNKAAFFALGIASTYWTDKGRTAPYLAALIQVLLIAAAHGQAEKLLPPLVWTLCLAAQLSPGRMPPVAAFLRSRPIQWLGLISFPIYLANEPVQKLLLFVLLPAAGADARLFNALWLPAAVLSPIAVAGLLHRFVEAPAVRLGRAIARGEPPGRAVGLTPANP